MASPQFQIPPEFRSKIYYVESLDSRSDEEILRSLKDSLPVTSERNIWAFWHSGIESMPDWCKRNVANWARLCGSSWVIRVLDNLPNSPNNALNWIEADQLPEAFVTQNMEGPRSWTGPHSADFLRGICLYRYGGVWIDVGAILMRTIDDICWRELEDPRSPYQVAAPWLSGNSVLNAFIASRKGDPFIKAW